MSALGGESRKGQREAGCSLERRENGGTHWRREYMSPNWQYRWHVIDYTIECNHQRRSIIIVARVRNNLKMT